MWEAAGLEQYQHMLDPLKLAQFGVFSGRKKSSTAAIEQCGQPRLHLWRRPKCDYLLCCGLRREEIQDLTIDMRGDGRLLKAERQEFGDAIAYLRQLGRKLVGNINGNGRHRAPPEWSRCTHSNTLCGATR